ncbi:hypothetical protein QBC35DRAFT_464036 [Podospora australis]|uniref:YTH domain-containing protein n=1 Tax=Podospora australis TaxID=1536484 RepID=A0AAN6WT47_9PEZI|nr:hypothetical protein QBC35DRAFT_464036 [Podospora australis]
MAGSEGDAPAVKLGAKAQALDDHGPPSNTVQAAATYDPISSNVPANDSSVPHKTPNEPAAPASARDDNYIAAWIKSAKSAQSTGLGVLKVPDLKDWLELTGFHEIEARTRKLDDFRRRRALEQDRSSTDTGRNNHGHDSSRTDGHRASPASLHRVSSQNLNAEQNPSPVPLNLGRTHGTRYFHTQCCNGKRIATCMKDKIWAVPQWQMTFLNTAFLKSQNFILFFIARDIEILRGVARMTSSSSPDIPSAAWMRSCTSISDPFRVEWLNTTTVAHQKWTGPKFWGGEGMEIEPEVGAMLLEWLSNLKASSDGVRAG